jgi:hypothetical protein
MPDTLMSNWILTLEEVFLPVIHQAVLGKVTDYGA